MIPDVDVLVKLATILTAELVNDEVTVLGKTVIVSVREAIQGATLHRSIVSYKVSVYVPGV